jgi:hypothetical protein
MNVSNTVTLARLNELIDNNGSSIWHACANRRAFIARRSAEGRPSPNAEAELAALLALGSGYETPAQIAHSANNAASGFGL